VLTIEWFQDGPRLLANEMAPRVHNSGHWTIEGAFTSQFENHLRAVCGWPLGRADAVGFSAMFNFIGSVPPTAEVLRQPAAHLHTYGKAPRPGRKVGHVTLRAATADELAEKLPEWSRAFDRKRGPGA
jgi:5-(carboxyamino)imidazole ribonucleotide synthase